MSTQANDDDARIEALETKVAHQDQALVDLSEEVFRQQQEIAKLMRLLRELDNRLEPLEQGQAAPGPRDEIPPHY